ncbi:MAG: glycosyltransferase [Vicinamibacterales bacterium]
MPTFNQRGTIQSKLHELATLDYPTDRLHVIVVDGGSSDGTRDAVRSGARRDAAPTALAHGLRRCGLGHSRAAQSLFALSLPLWTVAIVTTALLMCPFVQLSACYAKASLRATEPEVG